MAENVAVTTLEIRGTEKVATSMKELKKQISDYRDQLVALGQIENKTEKQMEEQVVVMGKLQKATKLLSEVTNAHKKSSAELDKAIDKNTASYNELQAELTRLKKAYKDMSAMERDSEFGAETLKNISELDVKLKDLDAGMGQYQRNVGNYGQTFEESMAKARQSSGYLAQGIGTLNGILALSGVENEGLKKGLIATTLALQVMQNEGVSKLIIKLKDMIAAKKATAVATSTLKKALVGLGIGAVVAGVVALVSNWDKLRKLIKGSTADFESSAKAIKKEEDALKSNLEMMKAKGATNEEVLTTEIKYLSEIKQKYDDLALSMLEFDSFKSGEYQKAADKAAEKQEEFNEKLSEGERLLRGVVAAGSKAWDQRFMSDYEKKLDDLNRQYEQMTQLRKEIFRAGGLSSGTEFLTLGNEIDAWYQQQLDMLNEERNKQQDARIAASRQQDAKEAEDRRKSKEKLLADLEAYDQAAIAEEERYGEEMYDQLSWQLEQELEAKRLAAEKEKGILLDTIHAREEADKKEAELAAERKQMYIDSAFDTASATTSILGSIADTIEALAGDEEEAAKRTKGIRIASTTIDTISGATGAYMQAAASISPPGGIIVGAVNAAAVLAAGMANIAKMKATTTTSASNPSFTTSASVNAPSVATQLDSVRNVTSASEEERLNRMAQSQKVYILQSDIEAAGAASKVQVTESTF